MAWFLARHEMPGPRALTLRRKDVGDVLARRRHVVCEKSDGVRLGGTGQACCGLSDSTGS